MNRFWGPMAIMGMVIYLTACSSGKQNNSSSTSKKNTSNPSYVVDYKTLPTELREKFSQLMQVPKEEITNLPLYQFINGWLQVPYKLGGQSKSGVDCSSFTQQLVKEVYKKQIPRTSLAQYNGSGWLNKRDNLQEGDLVFFNTGSSAKVNHVGIYLKNQRFVSATTSRGVIVTSLNDAYWSKAYVGAGRY